MRDVWLLLLELKQTVCGSQMCCDAVVTAIQAVFTCPPILFPVTGELYLHIGLLQKTIQ
jgi:hypothetical protein